MIDLGEKRPRAVGDSLTSILDFSLKRTKFIMIIMMSSVVICHMNPVMVDGFQ